MAVAPKYVEFVAAYVEAVKPLEAIICNYDPEARFHGSVGSDTKIVDTSLRRQSHSAARPQLDLGHALPGPG